MRPVSAMALVFKAKREHRECCNDFDMRKEG